MFCHVLTVSRPGGGAGPSIGMTAMLLLRGTPGVSRQMQDLGLVQDTVLSCTRRDHVYSGLTKHRGLAVSKVRLQSPFEHILMHDPDMTSAHTRPDPSSANIHRSSLGQGFWNS